MDTATGITPNGIRVRTRTWEFPVWIDSDAPEWQQLYHSPGPLTVKVTIVRPIAGLEALLRRLAWISAAVTAGIGALIVMATAWSTGRALAPVNLLAQRIDELKDESIEGRLGRPAVRELVPVVDRLNRLFGKLAEYVENEKAFSAALAHELRTPLAGLLTTIDVCLARERDATEYRDSLVACRRMVSQMGTMAERLLLVSRLEAGLYTARTNTVSLAALIRDSWQVYCASANERSLTVSLDTEHEVLAHTDPDLLRIVLTNLFDNAICHTPKRGRIEVRTQQFEQTSEIIVRNSGCTLAKEDAPAVFDRFWRGDQERDAAGRHCGLGLSLCQHVLTTLHGSIAATVHEGWFSVIVRVPTWK
jgi:two-component system heavy metal sensor histidine kinase CusS